MTELIKSNVAETIKEWHKIYVEDKKPFDVIAEMGELYMRCILIAAFSLDLKDKLLPYKSKGVTRQLSVGVYLRMLTSFLIFRQGRFLYAFIPYMPFFFYNQEDREYLENIRCLRNFLRSLIEERKLNMKLNDQRNDLLTILLSDEIYSNNMDLMIDECVTFFLAGSFTLKTTSSNLIQYLDLNQASYYKLMQEIKSIVKLTHSEDELKMPIDTKKAFTFETIEEMKYFICCFYESLRLEPPTVTSGVSASENTELEGYKIKKGDMVTLNLQMIQSNPD